MGEDHPHKELLDQPFNQPVDPSAEGQKRRRKKDAILAGEGQCGADSDASPSQRHLFKRAIPPTWNLFDEESSMADKEVARTWGKQAWLHIDLDRFRKLPDSYLNEFMYQHIIDRHYWSMEVSSRFEKVVTW